jgi:monoamine oxidase
MKHLPILIIGAGVAGLSAATALRADGIDCVVVEAASCVGGRARTTMIGHHHFDHGASWLHAAERNPIADLARMAGLTLINAEHVRTRRVMIGHTVATRFELAERAQAYEDFERMAGAETRDIAIADAIEPLRTNPWTASIEAWEACQIAAADPDDFSVIDWRNNALEGANLHIPGGIGTFVCTTLAESAGPIAINTQVSAIDWSGPIVATTSAGEIAASACIITVSTAAAARIRFTPALPNTHADALDNLPMGLLTKVALRATGADRLGLRPDESVTAQIIRGQPMFSLLAWPSGADHVVAFVGGPQAWDFARQGPAATIAAVRKRLRDWFGPRADAALADATVTDWHDNPLHGGAYAYARAGHATARAALAAPIADGRLIFAGEATAQHGLAGTVGGAWNEGQRAAAIAAAARSHPS